MKPIQVLKSLFIVSLAAFLLSSCSKKEKESPSQLIVGTWNISTASVDATVDGTPFVDYLVNAGIPQAMADSLNQALTSGIMVSNGSTIEFKSDGTANITESGSTTSGTWSLNSDGTKLTVDEGSQGTVVFDVVTLDAHNLDIKYSYDDMEQQGDGSTVDIKITLEIKLTK